MQVPGVKVDLHVQRFFAGGLFRFPAAAIALCGRRSRNTLFFFLFLLMIDVSSYYI